MSSAISQFTFLICWTEIASRISYIVARCISSYFTLLVYRNCVSGESVYVCTVWLVHTQTDTRHTPCPMPCARAL